MKKQLSILFVLLVGVGSILAGCGGTSNAEKQQLNLNIGSEPPSLNSVLATDSVSFTILNNVMEGLYRLGPDNAPTPGIAESYTVSSDGLTYTFKLRDAEWSNGTKVTANDFVYAWRKLVDPATGASYAFILGDYLANGSEVMAGTKETSELGVTATDDTTLVVTLKQVTPYFLGLTTFPVYLPQNEAFVTSAGEDYALEFDKLIYNGPFAITEWEHEQSLVLEKNDTYWDAKTVKLQKISYVMVNNTDTAINLYNSGKLDSVGLVAQYVNLYKGTPEFFTEGDSAVFYLQFNYNFEGGVFQNVKLRKAIDAAYDKAGITETILKNGSKPAYYFVPGEFVIGPDGTDFRVTNGDLGSYDPAAAKTLFDEALAELEVTSLTIELLGYDSDTSKKMTEFIKSELEKNLPGLTVTLAQLPFDQKLAREKDGNFQLSFAGWGPDYQDPMTFLDMWVTGGPYNGGGYASDAYDALIERAKGPEANDLEARWATMLEAEKLLYDDQIISPIYQRGGTGLRKTDIKGLAIHLFGPDVTYKWTYRE